MLLRNAGLLLLLLAIVLSGCSWASPSKVFVPAPPDVDDPGVPVGSDGSSDESLTTLKGRVVFADTDLGLWSRVSFGDRTVLAPDGTFSIGIPQGPNAYTIATLLGTYEGEIMHDGQGRFFPFPEFLGWSKTYFNDLLVGFGAEHTIRWRRGATIPVWIQSPLENGKTTWQAADLAWSVFGEWQQIVGDAITFQRTNVRSAAEDHGIVVLFDRQANVAREARAGSNVIGLCSVWYRRGSAQGEISRGQVLIAHERQDSPALHRHEIGHCIGLSHSNERDDVMYAVLTDQAKPISTPEQRIMQLLYSIPPATQAFAADGAVMRILSPFDAVHIDNPDGTVRRIIPMYDLQAETI